MDTFDKDFDILYYFSEIIERVPLSILQHIFKRNNLIAGRSSSATLEKVSSFFQEGNFKKINSLKSIVHWYLNDFMLHGEKSLYLFRLDKEKCAELFSLLGKLEEKQHEFTSNFPFSLRNHDLKKQLDNVVLSNIDKSDNKIILIYCSARYFTSRIKMPKSTLKEEFLDQYKDVSEILAINHKYRQFFDLIVIHKNGLVEFRIDNPKLDNSNHIPSNERISAFNKLRNEFENNVSNIKGRKWVICDPVNLFPLIDKIYLDRKEGVVRNLSFTTNNGGSKNLCANAKNANDCCRKDAYHIGGSETVNHALNPYRINIAWNRGDTRPELYFPGTIYHLDGVGVELNEAILTKIENKEDYDSIINKILYYLDNG